MILRDLQLADLDALAPELADLDLMRRYGRSADALARDLRLCLERGEGMLVAEDQGRPVGIAWYLTRGTFGLGGYLKLIAVTGAAQGKGVGAELLEGFERRTAQRSRHAFLLVSDFNRSAQAFYERRGYRRVGALDGLLLPDVSELIFHKRL